MRFDNIFLYFDNRFLHFDNRVLHCDNSFLQCDNRILHCDNRIWHYCFGLTALESANKVLILLLTNGLKRVIEVNKTTLEPNNITNLTKDNSFIAVIHHEKFWFILVVKSHTYQKINFRYVCDVTTIVKRKLSQPHFHVWKLDFCVFFSIKPPYFYKNIP